MIDYVQIMAAILIHEYSKIQMHKKRATPVGMALFAFRCLTMSYSHMGRPHTTIGAERFHF